MDKTKRSIFQNNTSTFHLLKLKTKYEQGKFTVYLSNSMQVLDMLKENVSIFCRYVSNNLLNLV